MLNSRSHFNFSNLTFKLDTDKRDLVLPIKLTVYSLRYLPASDPDHLVIISERDISLQDCLCGVSLPGPDPVTDWQDPAVLR